MSTLKTPVKYNSLSFVPVNKCYLNPLTDMSGISVQKQNREERGTEQQQQTYQFTQGYSILHRLQVHHLTLTVIIHNKLHTYVYELF